MIEWNEDKRLSNIEKHGFDFIDGAEVFGRLHAIMPAKRTGEDRLLAIGMIKGRFAAVVYTMRGLDYRIISIRSARKNERNEYQKLLAR